MLSAPRPRTGPPKRSQSWRPRHPGYGGRIGAEADFKVGGYREQVDGVRGKERLQHQSGTRVALRWIARLGGDKGGELGLGHADSRGEALGDGVQEGVDQPGLATVQALKAVQPDIGRPQLRSLHPIADPLQ